MMGDREDVAAKRQWVARAVDRFESPLIRYAAELLGDPDEARDVVQDAFLALCRADLSSMGNHLGPWLFAVCRNRAVDRLRAEGRVSPLDPHAEPEPASTAPLPSASAETKDEYERVLAIVATLPPSQREVVRLRFDAELSYREIGEVTGKSESNVGYLLHVALATIRSRLDEASPQPAR